MLPTGAVREAVLKELDALEALDAESIYQVSRRTGIPEADVYGVATFYHLIAHVDRRVCRGGAPRGWRGACAAGA